MASTLAARKISANIDMCEGPLFKKIVLFAVPLFLTSILNLLFNAADLIVVGRFGSSVSVAAVGATTSLIHLIVNLFMGVSSGVGVTVATEIGAQNNLSVKRTVHPAIPLSVVFGGIINVVMFLFAEPLLLLMDTPDDVIGLSTVYLKIYSCGMVPTMVYNFAAAILRAEGDTAKPLMFLSLSGVINVILNVIFVVAFNMDVAGVALATALSQTVSAVLVIIELMRRKDCCRLRLRRMRFHHGQLGKVLAVGIPAGIQSITFSLSNVIIQSSINSFGSIAMAGSAAAASIGSFVFVGCDTFQQTAMNFAGQNYGAGKIDRVRRTLALCLISVTVTELVLGLASVLFATPLHALYITDSDLAIEYGIRRTVFVCVPYFIAGIMNVFSGTIRALGHSVSPMAISIFSNCVFRVFWIFTVFAGFRSSDFAWEILFSSYPISWTLAVIVQIAVYTNIIRKVKN